MAVVRITEDLKGSVLNIVSKQFDKAEEEAKKLRPEIGQEVFDIFLKEYIPDMQRVPKEFFSTTDDVSIHIVNPGGHKDIQEQWSLDNNETRIPYALPEPANEDWDSRYNTPTIKIHRGDKRFNAVLEKVDNWQNALKKVADERAVARHDVKNILESFSTLAPALRAWPALWDLLPKYVQDKHKEIVERSKPAPVKVDTSKLDGLTAKLVMANINKKVDGSHG